MLKELRVEYIYHSGFSLSFDERIFIFDYYKGQLPELNKPASFLVSHSHEDHFNPAIFDIESNQPIDYILADDILDYEKKGNVIKLGGPGEIEQLKNVYSQRSYIVGDQDHLILDDYTIKTFPSTDRGISFLLDYHGINIFHAGDLNLWIWEEDSPEERDLMYQDFMSIIKDLAKYHVDIAFFPLDPRLADHYADGFNIFIDEIEPSIIFPMHFKDEISYNLRYLSDHKENSQTFRPIFKNNQFFIINYEA